MAVRQSCSRASLLWGFMDPSQAADRPAPDIDRQALQELRRSEERFRLLFESTGDGLVLADVDTLQLGLSNARFREMTGYSVEDLYGMSVAEMHPARDLPMVMREVKRHLRGEGSSATDIPVKRADGSVFQANVNSTVIELAGRRWIVAAFRDMTERRAAEQALHTGLDRAQHYLDIAGNMIVALDAEGRVTLVNRKGLEVLGYGEHEVTGQNWFENFLPEAGRDEVLGAFASMMAGEVQSVEYYENEVLTSDGRKRLVAWRNSLLRDEDGNICGTLSSGEDITESRAAEEALRENERKYRSFVENFEGIAFRGTLDFRPTFFHGAVQEVTGYQEGDFLDGGLRWDQVMHPEDLERLTAEGVLQRTGESPDYSHELEYRIVRKGGEVRWVCETIQNLCDEDGRPCAVQGTIVDVTERRRMEEERRRYAERLEAEVAERTREIRASEERHRALFENVDHAVVTTDLAGRVQNCNQATESIFGKAEGQLKGLEIHQALCGGERREEFQQLLAAVLRTGTTTHECAARRADGQELSVNASVSALRDRTGKPEGMIWILTDMSERQRLEAEASRAHEYADMVLRSYGAYGQLVGRGEVFRRMISFVQDAARVSSAVLLGGESGTGKEAVARSIHSYSQRAEQPFVVVDCAALKGSLLESELFGHEKGAFTGAHEAKRGLAEVADGGTLFLDEIGEMPIALQAKLLRVLEHGEFRRVGSVKDAKTDIRVIAATNRDLVEEGKRGQFRTDLYFRLNVLSFEIPPLRERPEDIPLLASHFLMHSRVTFVGQKRFRQEALSQLEKYSWPGNVRELANVVERAIILSGEEAVLRSAHLPPEVRAASSEAQPALAGGVRSIADAEREAVGAAMQATGGNRTRAAKMLGISTVTLRQKIKKYKIADPKKK